MLLAHRSVRRSWFPTLAVGISLVSAALLLAASSPALAQTGTISGTVTDSVTGAPIAGMWVAVSDARGGPVVAYLTTASGSYAAGGLSAGTYYVHASSSLSSGAAAEYLDEVYNGPYPTAGLLCLMSCAATSGAPVTVIGGLTTASIDFALEIGGRMSASSRTVPGPRFPLVLASAAAMAFRSTTRAAFVSGARATTAHPPT